MSRGPTPSYSRFSDSTAFHYAEVPTGGHGGSGFAPPRRQQPGQFQSQHQSSQGNFPPNQGHHSLGVGGVSGGVSGVSGGVSGGVSVSGGGGGQLQRSFTPAVGASSSHGSRVGGGGFASVNGGATPRGVIGKGNIGIGNSGGHVNGGHVNGGHVNGGRVNGGHVNNNGVPNMQQQQQQQHTPRTAQHFQELHRLHKQQLAQARAAQGAPMPQNNVNNNNANQRNNLNHGGFPHHGMGGGMGMGIGGPPTNNNNNNNNNNNHSQPSNGYPSAAAVGGGGGGGHGPNEHQAGYVPDANYAATMPLSVRRSSVSEPTVYRTPVAPEETNFYVQGGNSARGGAPPSDELSPLGESGKLIANGNGSGVGNSRVRNGGIGAGARGRRRLGTGEAPTTQQEKEREALRLAIAQQQAELERRERELEEQRRALEEERERHLRALEATTGAQGSGVPRAPEDTPSGAGRKRAPVPRHESSPSHPAELPTPRHPSSASKPIPGVVDHRRQPPTPIAASVPGTAAQSRRTSLGSDVDVNGNGNVNGNNYDIAGDIDGGVESDGQDDDGGVGECPGSRGAVPPRVHAGGSNGSPFARFHTSANRGAGASAGAVADDSVQLGVAATGDSLHSVSIHEHSLDAGPVDTATLPVDRGDIATQHRTPWQQQQQQQLMQTSVVSGKSQPMVGTPRGRDADGQNNNDNETDHGHHIVDGHDVSLPPGHRYGGAYGTPLPTTGSAQQAASDLMDQLGTMAAARGRALSTDTVETTGGGGAQQNRPRVPQLNLPAAGETAANGHGPTPTPASHHPHTSRHTPRAHYLTDTVASSARKAARSVSPHSHMRRAHNGDAEADDNGVFLHPSSARGARDHGSGNGKKRMQGKGSMSARGRSTFKPAGKSSAGARAVSADAAAAHKRRAAALAYAERMREEHRAKLGAASAGSNSARGANQGSSAFAGSGPASSHHQHVAAETPVYATPAGAGVAKARGWVEASHLTQAFGAVSPVTPVARATVRIGGGGGGRTAPGSVIPRHMPADHHGHGAQPGSGSRGRARAGSNNSNNNVNNNAATGKKQRRLRKKGTGVTPGGDVNIAKPKRGGGGAVPGLTYGRRSKSASARAASAKGGRAKGSGGTANGTVQRRGSVASSAASGAGKRKAPSGTSRSRAGRSTTGRSVSSPASVTRVANLANPGKRHFGDPRKDHSLSPSRGVLSEGYRDCTSTTHGGHANTNNANNGGAGDAAAVTVARVSIRQFRGKVTILSDMTPTRTVHLPADAPYSKGIGHLHEEWDGDAPAPGHSGSGATADHARELERKRLLELEREHTAREKSFESEIALRRLERRLSVSERPPVSPDRTGAGSPSSHRDSSSSPLRRGSLTRRRASVSSPLARGGDTAADIAARSSSDSRAGSYPSLESMDSSDHGEHQQQQQQQQHSQQHQRHSLSPAPSSARWSRRGSLTLRHDERAAEDSSFALSETSEVPKFALGPGHSKRLSGASGLPSSSSSSSANAAANTVQPARDGYRGSGNTADGEAGAYPHLQTPSHGGHKHQPAASSVTKASGGGGNIRIALVRPDAGTTPPRENIGAELIEPSPPASVDDHLEEHGARMSMDADVGMDDDDEEDNDNGDQGNMSEYAGRGGGANENVGGDAADGHDAHQNPNDIDNDNDNENENDHHHHHQQQQQHLQPHDSFGASTDGSFVGEAPTAAPRYAGWLSLLGTEATARGASPSKKSHDGHGGSPGNPGNNTGGGDAHNRWRRRYFEVGSGALHCFRRGPASPGDERGSGHRFSVQLAGAVAEPWTGDGGVAAHAIVVTPHRGERTVIAADDAGRAMAWLHAIENEIESVDKANQNGDEVELGLDGSGEHHHDRHHHHHHHHHHDHGHNGDEGDNGDHHQHHNHEPNDVGNGPEEGVLTPTRTGRQQPSFSPVPGQQEGIDNDEGDDGAVGGGVGVGGGVTLSATLLKYPRAGVSKTPHPRYFEASLDTLLIKWWPSEEAMAAGEQPKEATLSRAVSGPAGGRVLPNERKFPKSSCMTVVVVDADLPLELHAADKEERDRWVAAINNAVET